MSIENGSKNGSSAPEPKPQMDMFDFQSTGRSSLIDNLSIMSNGSKVRGLSGKLLKMAQEAISRPDFFNPDTRPRIRGADLLNHNKTNKGMAFSLKERQLLGIHGLLPPAVLTIEDQIGRVMKNLELQPNDLARYVQLNALQDRNEKLFYRVLTDYVEQLMPIVYTPTVGLACQRFGFIFRRPKGIYITIYDNTVERIYEILSNWPENDIRAIVVTDGERILGLGDLGAYGMGIPIGKLSLYVALARVNPRWCLPILLDVGTDNETLLQDKYYTGIKHKRIRGAEYDKFVDNFMKACVLKFGQQCLIQFEDFGNSNAFRFLEMYKNKYCTFNDDIQVDSYSVASIGMASLICMAMQKEAGISFEEAAKRVWMVDSRGLIVKGRSNVSHHKERFAQTFKEMKDLNAIVKELKPTCIIGASTIPNTFNEEIIKDMAKFNDRPIIFALSNPTSKAECTAEQAYKFTNGKAIFASGSPFNPVTVAGKTLYPGQGNNSYIFPGVSLAVILSGVHHVGDELFLLASETLAEMVTPTMFEEGRVYPPLTDIKEISAKIATKVVEHCYKHGLASHYPEPEDKEEFVRSQMYSVEYGSFEPEIYDYPKDVVVDRTKE
uniref:Malic enzyme n=1 Tax=Romanomermis culicivorax TaxID=13658 RepID=A0A915HU72_ROMCU